MNILVLSAGHWDLMFAYKVPPPLQIVSRVSYDIIDYASGMLTDDVAFEETVVMKDGT